MSPDEILDDLRHRLAKAETRLDGLAAEEVARKEKGWSYAPLAVARLEGKASGVRLALSYLADYAKDRA